METNKQTVLRKVTKGVAVVTLSIGLIQSVSTFAQGSFCQNKPGTNNGHCRPAGAGYACVDAYWFETLDCKKT